MNRFMKSFVSALSEYASRVKSFRPNARLYLINVIIVGAAMGIFRLLFNFYVLSLGFDEALLGSLVTASSLAALIMALPMGYLADQLGRKASLLVSGSIMALAIMIMVLFPYPGIFSITNVLFGVAQSLAAVTMAPFLMENSGDEERTYLFSFSSGLQMASASIGNWIGGYLPSWVASFRIVEPTSSQAYGGSLLVVGIVAFVGLLPLALLRMPNTKRSERTVFAPITYAAKHPRTLGKLILPMLITSIGAGLIMPFMNVFFRQVYNQPDPVIGSLFAWGSLAMGLGLLIAPPLADRMGKIQLVVITQGLSIPFLILLGFSPWFWLSTAAYYVRVALMNMSGPVYQTYVMEHVDPSARATVASLVSMSWNFGWAFSPMVSGWLQVNYGFGPPFIGTIVLYTISVYLYWAFFWKKHRPINSTAPGTGRLSH
jgi:MFS family permease